MVSHSFSLRSDSERRSKWLILMGFTTGQRGWRSPDKNLEGACSSGCNLCSHPPPNVRAPLGLQRWTSGFPWWAWDSPTTVLLELPLWRCHSLLPLMAIPTGCYQSSNSCQAWFSTIKKAPKSSWQDITGDFGMSEHLIGLSVVWLIQLWIVYFTRNLRKEPPTPCILVPHQCQGCSWAMRNGVPSLHQTEWLPTSHMASMTRTCAMLPGCAGQHGQEPFLLPFNSMCHPISMPRNVPSHCFNFLRWI